MGIPHVKTIQGIIAEIETPTGSPYRETPKCSCCKGKGETFEFDGMGESGFEKCERCNGSGDEPRP